MSDFVRMGGGPYLWGQSECKNAECGVEMFDVLLIKGFTLSGSQGAWGPYYEHRCPGCGARVRNLKRRPGARPRKTFPKGAIRPGPVPMPTFDRDGNVGRLA